MVISHHHQWKINLVCHQVVVLCQTVQTKAKDFYKNAFQNIPLICILLFLINTASRFLQKSERKFFEILEREKNFEKWNWPFWFWNWPFLSRTLLDIRIVFLNETGPGLGVHSRSFWTVHSGPSTYGQDSLKPKKVPCMVHTS